MDDLDLIGAYARTLEEALALAGRPAQPLVDETIAHLLEDAARIARVEGCDDAEAARRAIARFGDVAAIVAASRDNGRTVARGVAWAASAVVLAAMAFVTVFRPYDWEMGWPLVGGTLPTVSWMLLFGELTLVTLLLRRALDRGAATRLTTLALELNAGAAAGFLAGYFVLGVPRHILAASHIGLVHVLNVAPPLWVLMLVQSLAGLRALRARRDRDGALVAA